jgi:hypothetical protein
MNRKTKTLWLIGISALFASLVSGPITECLFNNLEISTLKAIMIGSFVANIILAIGSIFEKRLKKNGLHDMP